MAVRLSALRAGRSLPPGRFLYSFMLDAKSTEGHSAAGRIRSIDKRLSDLIGNRNRDLPACSIVHQPTTSLSAPAFVMERIMEKNTGFGVLAPVAMRNYIFWDATPCSPVKVNKIFRWTMLPPSSGSKNKPRKKPTWRRQLQRKPHEARRHVLENRTLNR
jgi:hypothetical protein